MRRLCSLFGSLGFFGLLLLAITVVFICADFAYCQCAGCNTSSQQRVVTSNQLLMTMPVVQQRVIVQRTLPTVTRTVVQQAPIVREQVIEQAPLVQERVVQQVPVVMAMPNYSMMNGMSMSMYGGAGSGMMMRSTARRGLFGFSRTRSVGAGGW